VVSMRGFAGGGRGLFQFTTSASAWTEWVKRRTQSRTAGNLAKLRGIATGRTTDDDSRQGQGEGQEQEQEQGGLPFVTASRPALGPTQPPVKCVPDSPTPGVKQPGHEVDHLHLVQRLRMRGATPPLPTTPTCRFS